MADKELGLVYNLSLALFDAHLPVLALLFKRLSFRAAPASLFHDLSDDFSFISSGLNTYQPKEHRNLDKALTIIDYNYLYNFAILIS